MTVAPPSSCKSFTEIEAEWRAGTTSTFAGPERRENGYFFISSTLRATSTAISPSNSKSTPRCPKTSGAILIFSARSETGYPKVEKLTKATLGSKPKTRATPAPRSAISAKSFSFGHSCTNVSDIKIIFPFDKTAVTPTAPS